MSVNSNPKIVTAVSIIVALAAIVYAMSVHMQASNNASDGDTMRSASVMNDEKSGPRYEIGEENPVVMTLGGRKVTRLEVMDAFTQSGSQIPPNANLEQAFPLLQEQYLITFMLNDAARQQGIDGTTPEVAKRIEEAREQAIRAAYLDFIAEENVTDNDVRNTYDDIIANSEAMIERRARHILVETQDEAEALITQLNDGADFEELARENSTGPSAENGGDLGFFAPNEMVPAFAQAAFQMDVGSTSNEPVETQFGFHVIKVEEERSRPKPTFEEMQGQIEQQLRQAVIREKIQEIREGMDVVVLDFDGNPIDDVEPAAADNMDETATETEAMTDTTQDAEQTQE